MSGWRLVEFWLAWVLLLGGVCAVAQAPATTAVTDTVYKADGTAASGTVLISWTAFTTAGGSNVPAGSRSVTLGAGGALNVALVPNAGSTPMGSYYTVVYHLGDGSVTREYWVVPATTFGVKVGALKSTVLPATVAMQTVSKSYVDRAIAAATTGHPLDSSPYVVKTGDTMTGALTLPGDPVAPLQASDKNYVDTQVAGLSAGNAQKVTTVPQGTQTVAQPAGTELAVNRLNGALYADQFVSGGGNNGIANATATPDCANGCDVVAPQNYASVEAPAPTTWNNQTHVDDRRGGTRLESYFNPRSPFSSGNQAAEQVDVVTTQSAAELHAQTGSGQLFSTNLVLTNEGLAGGSNVFPEGLQGPVPYFKTTYSTLNMTSTNHTLGQHVMVAQGQNCYGVGDCLMGGLFMYSSGGFRDDADEGAHPFDLQFTEDPKVFAGNCAGGCATGATVVQVAATANGGTQGEGRYLIDTNPAKVITAGTLVGGVTAGRQPSATFAGTNFPVSVFLETAQLVPTQADNITPGVVNVAIVTGGVPAGFATNTAALPATSGVACVSDTQTPQSRPLYFETAAYTVVDGSHLQMNLLRPHSSGATIAVGGLCGYGLEQMVDTRQGIRQVFPVIGASDGQTVLYAGGQTSIVGVQGAASGFANVNLVVAQIVRTNNVVTVTIAGNFSQDVSGLTLQVQGVADPSYNGNFVVNTTGPNTLQYAETGPDSTSAGGTLNAVTGGYALYPMAEVLGVYNATTKAVDGQLTLAANTVPWAAGDAVEEPHYFQESVSADEEYITQYAPRPSRDLSAGINYGGLNGPGLYGWNIANGTAASEYFGNGGTHTVPNSAVRLQGAWRTALEMQAGEQTAVTVHCNSHGCGKWNSAYDLMHMDSNAGADLLRYSPQTSTLTAIMRGATYQFDPNGFTAATINVGTLHAGQINGVFTGTITASSVPVFGASGSGHTVGGVPDPGPNAGTARYLREDGVWSAPAGGAGSNAGSGGGTATVALSTGPLNMPERASLLGEYLMNEGAGTVVHDTSGAGNDGTFGGLNGGPSWEGGVDLNFDTPGEYVSVPNALNAARSWMIAFYQAPFGTLTAPQAPGYGDPGSYGHNASLLCGTTSQHACWIASSLYGAQSTRMMAFTTDRTESAEAMPAGWHTVTMICGPTPENRTHYLFDGVEVGSYISQGFGAPENGGGTCGHPTIGNYQIGGSSLLDSSWFKGKMAALWSWSTVLTVGEGAAAAKSALDYIHAKGVPLGYSPVVQKMPQVIAGLDSRTYGTGVTPATSWPMTMALDDATTVRVNLGVQGETTFDGCQQFELTYGQYLSKANGPAIVMIWGGVNDFTLTSSQGPRQIADNLRCMTLKAKAAGARVVLATEISELANQTTILDTKKYWLDTILRNEWRSWGVDNLVDLATDARLGADGASKDTGCFPDNLHPGPGCEPEIAVMMGDAVNELTGSSETARHTTGAGSYQEVAGDRFLDLNGGGAQAVTLATCTGKSLGREVVNLGGQAASVAAMSGQMLTGSQVIGVGARALFVPVPGDLSTGGCRWQRTE